MTLVNFRRAILPFAAATSPYVARSFAFPCVASKLQREFRAALFSHSSSPGRPRSETSRSSVVLAKKMVKKREKEERRESFVSLSSPTFQPRSGRCIAHFFFFFLLHLLLSSSFSPPSHHQPFPIFSPFLPLLTPTLVHAYTHPGTYRVAAHTPLQNFLTLRRYKYLQPRRRACRVSRGRRTRARGAGQ